MRNEKALKTVDVVVWTLLTIGGLNWGLIGIFNFNLVAFIFGELSILSRIVYILVGFSAIYAIVGVKSTSKRWNMQFSEHAHA